MKKMFMLLLLLTMLLSPALGFADSPWTEKPTYNSEVAGKLQLGLRNTFLGWTDLFIEPIHASRRCEQGENVVTGIGKGVMDALYNTVGGAIQLVTFPLIADVPLPEDGVQFSRLRRDCGTTKTGTTEVGITEIKS
jgi:hypothetical protein